MSKHLLLLRVLAEAGTMTVVTQDMLGHVFCFLYFWEHKLNLASSVASGIYLQLAA